jgi:hypothetical protein
MCAAFDFELSDAQFNALAAARTMSSVLALGPRGLWQFNQSSAGIPVGDMTGGGANEIGRLGTQRRDRGRPAELPVRHSGRAAEHGRRRS